MEQTQFHDVNWDAATTKKFLESSDKINSIEKEFSVHEAQCEERWKTTFTRLEAIEHTLERMDSRMLSMGGTIILFLAGVIVTLMNMGVTPA
jgi:hypothetical protein